ncbi:MAG: hypothetical protein ACOY40_08970 [Bacillota bacterium]
MEMALITFLSVVIGGIERSATMEAMIWRVVPFIIIMAIFLVLLFFPAAGHMAAGHDWLQELDE